MTSELESFKAREDRQKEAVVLPTAEELVEEERNAWQRFFGKEIDVPNPPQELIQTIERLSELGILGFEAHYLPEVTFEKDDEFPGWQVTPEEEFWQHIKNSKVAKEARKLSGNWVLIDSRPKPNYQDDNQMMLMYEDDYLAPLIEKLSQEGRVKHVQARSDDYVPYGSRFGLSWREIHQEVLPELAKMIGIPQNQLRLPKVIEFNLLGNIHHPEWGETQIEEWFEDNFEVWSKDKVFQDWSKDKGPELVGRCLRGGVALAYFYSSSFDFKHGGLGFRPLVEFPQK